ncbi:MAG: hypothetical protein Q7R35_18085 [Elusimicrobiota bacterium]|nr:hypothetical protein [Elusimicrobiota bacterium]
MARIIIALMLLWPAAARGAGPGAYYFTAVQNGAYNFKGGEGQLEESYKALQGMVKLADAQNARLTLLFSAQYAVYIASDPARLAELEGWKKTGHEIGAYHQGPETRAWDGYSDLPKEELERVRKEKRKSVPVPGRREYFEALGRLTPEIKSGCVPGSADEGFLAAAPAYEVCARPGDKGINEFLSVTGGGEKVKKRLSCFHPSDKAGIAAAKGAFSGLELGVYGASFKSSPSEFGAFYSWLAFLKGRDPQGLRSRTVSAIVDEGLLAEKEAVAAPAVKKTEKQKVQPRAETRKSETPRQEIPRLKPVPSKYGKVGTLVPELQLRRKYPGKGGYCGDGICDPFERSHPGRCPGECGR